MGPLKASKPQKPVMVPTVSEGSCTAAVVVAAVLVSAVEPEAVFCFGSWFEAISESRGKGFRVGA